MRRNSTVLKICTVPVLVICLNSTVLKMCTCISDVSYFYCIEDIPVLEMCPTSVLKIYLY